MFSRDRAEIKRGRSHVKVGVLGAMPEEVSDILDCFDDKAPFKIGDRTYWEGRWRGIDAVAVFSRWGKVASAATTAILISRFEVDHVLFVGVAGATDPSLKLGDIVVASELVQHDMDASAIPTIERFEIPLLGRKHFATDGHAADLAVRAANDFVDQGFDRAVPAEVRAAFAIRRPRVVRGLIASGDRFIADSASVADLQRLLPDLQCVEMEGAAVAQVCFELGIPVTVIRIISDRADHDAPIDFARFSAEVASVMAEGVASRFLDGLAGRPQAAPQTA